MYAKYTEFLRDLMLNPQTKPLLDKALSTYPLYASENQTIADLIPTRAKLNEKLLNHYKYREIGFETVGRFLDELEITMIEIMPRYNELFKTVEIMAELPSPFDNVDVVETFKQKAEGSSSNTGESENKNTGTSSSNQKTNSKTIESDTPQDSLSLGAKDINSVDYASTAGWSESEGNGGTSHEDNVRSSSSGASESESIVEHTLTKKGNQGVNTYAHDMNEFRTSIIDVVDAIINDERINELFMIVY